MTQEVLKFTKAITKPNTITFHNSNADWVMRITADRRIEVNEDVEVTEAAQKVLDAMQYLLKAQTQEPVAWMKDCADFWDYYICLNETAQEKYDQEAQIWIKTLRTATPQRTWVGLTDEEICTFSMWLDDKSDVAVFTAIEAKLKEKNT